MSQLSEIKNEVINFESKKEQNYGISLLGELLIYLRKNGYMGLLMICRQITKIVVNDNVVEFQIDNFNNENLFSNANYIQILKDFFATKNLDIKYKEQIIKESDAEKLNKLFGGQLVIKNKSK